MLSSDDDKNNVFLSYFQAMQEKERVCVYCASSAKIAPKYFEVATALAQELVKAEKKVVFGGGASGLMGRLADETLRLGGDIIGIMPHFMRKVEWAHREVKEFEFVDDMRERKKRLLEDSSAVVTLAGGSGTLEELIEAITLKRLGLYLNPIIIVNTDGYYDPLKTMLERCVSENFMHESHLKMWTFVDTPGEVLSAIENAPTWESDNVKNAAMK